MQGVGAGKHVESQLEPISLHGVQATALALVFSELLQNALEHGGDEVRVELGRENGSVRLAVVGRRRMVVRGRGRHRASRSCARSCARSYAAS